jgi:hypothetical protein
MYLTGSVRANCREEVLGLEAMCNIVELFAITGKEERSSPWSVSDANDVSLNISGTVGGRCEGLVVSSVSIRHV